VEFAPLLQVLFDLGGRPCREAPVFSPASFLARAVCPQIFDYKCVAGRKSGIMWPRTEVLIKTERRCEDAARKLLR
jgi:hypothetical protein